MAIPRPTGPPTTDAAVKPVAPVSNLPVTAKRALVTGRRKRMGSFAAAPSASPLTTDSYQIPTPVASAPVMRSPSPYGFGTPPVSTPSTSPLGSYSDLSGFLAKIAALGIGRR